MASSAMGLKFGVFGFLQTTHAKTMRPQSSHAVQHFTRVYLHARTAINTGDIRTWRTTIVLITKNTQRPPIWAPCRNKDGAGSGISGVYLWCWRNLVSFSWSLKIWKGGQYWLFIFFKWVLFVFKIENNYIFQKKIIYTTQNRHNFACDNYIFPKTRANKSKQWTHYSILLLH